jgi:HD superfamily phosphodiesterase
MKLTSFITLINYSLNYVINTTHKLNIDESHGLKHSLEVLHYAEEIYNSEVMKYPFLEKQKEIIYTSAILHDMCDKKYMDQEKGVEMIKNHMKIHMNKEQLEVMEKIISTMSYSTVKKNGFPELGEYQLAYHIVREADLLSAYDIDRCLIYSLNFEKLDYFNALKRVIEITHNRILTYRSDKLFVTNYSKNKSLKLHLETVKKVKKLEEILD